ncbi:Udp-glycosyltransferase 84a1 [Thalictrum thalictroides]|uniref:Udp-glycosyltransferase 84a1 n=1 Tax=Thalictrum thalictroides TaxID=46969 RepID=A0A7J6VWM4_THATH|nr:Udp-glycosyltransferase 84a1 [Thalictrum thalictroides]
MGSETLLPPHVLMVSFPGQGHVNPLLRLAKRLASKGLFITFSSTNNIGHMIQKSTDTEPGKPINIGLGQLRFEFFDDGWEDDDLRRFNLDLYMHQLETVGRDSFVQLINKNASLGRPVSCIVNNPFVPWASDVATDMGIPCAVQWVQSCAVFSAYYHYFHNLASFPTLEHPDISVDLPGLPTLSSDEVPSFLHPLDSPRHRSLKKIILGQFKNLEKSFSVLVDSFEELEHEPIKPLMERIPIRPVGPLFKFNDEDKSSKVRADMWTTADECIEWLDSKPAASVVYVSFGSIVFLEKAQMEEMARGLLNSGLSFLWVVKPPPKEYSEDAGRVPDGFIEEAKGKGLVVEWCPQDKVLAHPSLACFVTHCGWNSSMEILCSGVPIVTAPQWGDQVTNAKFLVDVYGVGVRLIRSEKDLKTLSREQVQKCITEVTSGPKAEEIKKNALKWKKAAEEASSECGSSNKNLQAFVDDVRQMASK